MMENDTYLILSEPEWGITHSIFDEIGSRNSFLLHHDIETWLVTLDNEQLMILKIKFPGLKFFKQINK